MTMTPTTKAMSTIMMGSMIAVSAVEWIPLFGPSLESVWAIG